MTRLRMNAAVTAASFLISASLLQVALPVTAIGQDIAVAVESKVAIEGRVAGVYQSSSDSLVQILVQKSGIDGIDRAGLARYPAPGEYVYVHVAGERPGARLQRGGNGLPQPRSNVRAFLTTDRSGQWIPDGRTWFEDATQGGNQMARRGSGGRSSAIGELGVTTEPVSVGRDTGLKVVRVARDSPAARAGVEPNDVIMQAKRRAVKSQVDLDNAYRSSTGSFSLTVRDVRSGRDILVDVEAMGAGGTAGGTPRMQSLGAKTELAFYGGEPALKVTDVASGSPAERAGLASGLLILEANGKALDNADALKKAELSSRGRLDLKVVDPKDKRERTVRVSL